MVVLKPFNFLCPTLLSVPVESVAKAMIVNLWNKPETSVEFIGNADIHRLSGECDKMFEGRKE